MPLRNMDVLHSFKMISRKPSDTLFAEIFGYNDNWSLGIDRLTIQSMTI